MLPVVHSTAQAGTFLPTTDQDQGETHKPAAMLDLRRMETARIIRGGTAPAGARMHRMERRCVATSSISQLQTFLHACVDSFESLFSLMFVSFVFIAHALYILHNAG